MTQLRSVNTHFWNDSFMLGCTPNERYLFLYLLTNDATTLAGCYEITLRRMAFDTGLSLRVVSAGIDKFQRAGKVIYRDGWIVLARFHKHQNLNKNMGIAAAKVLSSAPAWVLEAVRESLSSLGTVPEWLPNHSRTIKGREIEVEGEVENGVPPLAADAATKEPDAVETRIWKDGVDLLKRSGMSDTSATPLLGRWAKDFGRVNLATAIANAQAVNAPDPKAYIGGILREGKKPDVGKNDHVQPKYACTECLDTGVVSVPDPDGKWSFAMKDAPCPKPGCSDKRKRENLA
jgi:hypothetical protein